VKDYCVDTADLHQSRSSWPGPWTSVQQHLQRCITITGILITRTLMRVGIKRSSCTKSCEHHIYRQGIDSQHLKMVTALLTFTHPSSASESTSIQQSLPKDLSYYLSPESQCTSHIQFRPSTRPKAPFQQLSATSAASSASGPLLLGAFSTFASDAGLGAAQQKHQGGDLKEERSVWHVKGGFVARRPREKGHGNVVMLARFECKDAGKAKDAVVRALRLVSFPLSWSHGWG
jgi:hypothetical protein